MEDFAVGQGLLELGDAFVGDFGVIEPQVLKVDQSRDVFEPAVGHLGAAKIKALEVGQSLEPFQPEIGDPGFNHVKFYHACQYFEMGEIGISNGRATALGFVDATKEVIPEKLSQPCWS